MFGSYSFALVATTVEWLERTPPAPVYTVPYFGRANVLFMPPSFKLFFYVCFQVLNLRIWAEREEEPLAKFCFFFGFRASATSPLPMSNSRGTFTLGESYSIYTSKMRFVLLSMQFYASTNSFPSFEPSAEKLGALLCVTVSPPPIPKFMVAPSPLPVINGFRKSGFILF